MEGNELCRLRARVSSKQSLHKPRPFRETFSARRENVAEAYKRGVKKNCARERKCWQRMKTARGIAHQRAKQRAKRGNASCGEKLH